MKILFRYPPTFRFIQSQDAKKISKKFFPTKMKLIKCPAKKKDEARKGKEEERRESEKKKSRNLCHF